MGNAQKMGIGRGMENIARSIEMAIQERRRRGEERRSREEREGVREEGRTREDLLLADKREREDLMLADAIQRQRKEKEDAWERGEPMREAELARLRAETGRLGRMPATDQPKTPKSPMVKVWQNEISQLMKERGGYDTSPDRRLEIDGAIEDRKRKLQKYHARSTGDFELYDALVKQEQSAQLPTDQTQDQGGPPSEAVIAMEAAGNNPEFAMELIRELGLPPEEEAQYIDEIASGAVMREMVGGVGELGAKVVKGALAINPAAQLYGAVGRAGSDWWEGKKAEVKKSRYPGIGGTVYK